MADPKKADPKSTGGDRDSGRQPNAGGGASSSKKSEPQRGQGQKKGSNEPQEGSQRGGGTQHEGTSDRGSGTQRPQSRQQEPERDSEEEQQIDIPAGDPARRSPVYTDPPQPNVRNL